MTKRIPGPSTVPQLSKEWMRPVMGEWGVGGETWDVEVLVVMSSESLGQGSSRGTVCRTPEG